MPVLTSWRLFLMGWRFLARANNGLIANLKSQALSAAVGFRPAQPF
jgi:hypothetical protein